MGEVPLPLEAVDEAGSAGAKGRRSPRMQTEG